MKIVKYVGCVAHPEEVPLHFVDFVVGYEEVKFFGHLTMKSVGFPLACEPVATTS